MPGHLLEQHIESESLLHQLASRGTIILADTLHLETLSMNDPDGTMLNLENVFQAVAERKLDFQVWAATKIVLDRWSQEKETESMNRTRKEHVLRVLEQLFVELGMEMRTRAPGTHISLVDPRMHNDAKALVASTQRTYQLFKEKGVKKKDIMVSIPATEAGIRATKELQSIDHEMNINLYLVTSLMHTAACVEANATTVTIPVGLVLESFEGRRRNIKNVSRCQDGIEEIQSMFEYLNRREIRTRAVATSFRNMTELGLLSDCFALCVSPAQVERLKGGARAPINSLTKLGNNAKRRGQGAKYPTNLLTSSGIWFSGTSRNVINSVLFSGLNEMKRQMELIEHYVEQEVVQQFELDALDLSTVYKLQEWAKNILEKRENNGIKAASDDAHRGTNLEGTPRKPSYKKHEQDVDEIF